MTWPTPNDAKEAAICFWKYCLSFRKRDWSLDDYPVRIRKNQPLDLDLGARFKAEPYLAQVMKWWALSGGGDTPQQAKAALADAFNSAKAELLQRGRLLPRPGTPVPIEFAPQERINRDPDLKGDFVRRVIGLEEVWISDESSLWDFHTEETNDSMVKKVMEIYGVDVSDIESGNVAQILERIASSRFR
jgi:hypothetical protein